MAHVSGVRPSGADLRRVGRLWHRQPQLRQQFVCRQGQRDHDPYTDVRSGAWQREQSEWQQRFGSDIPVGERSLLEDELLEKAVRTTLMTDRANKLGYRISDAQLAAAVRAESAFQLDGHYNAEVAKSRLAQAGLTPEQYANDLQG